MATEREEARYQIRRRQTEEYLLTDLIGAETLEERALAVVVVWAGVERVKLKEEISLTRAHINELLTLWANFNVPDDEYNTIAIDHLANPERRRYLRDENNLLIAQKQDLLDITSFIATPLNRCHRQLLRLKLHVVIPAAHPEWTVPYPQWEDGIDPARFIPRPRW